MTDFNHAALCRAVLCRGPDLGLGPEKVRREIQLQARLDHVNIVELKQVSAARKQDGKHMPLMECR